MAGNLPIRPPIFNKTFLTPQASTSSQRPWISRGGHQRTSNTANKFYYISGIIAVIVLIVISGIIIATWSSSGDDDHPSSGEGIKALLHFPTIQKSKGKHDTSIIRIEVYYSTLDPVATHFITNQLIPVYFKLKEYIGEVELIPFGQTSTKISADGFFSFTCPNGPLECDGNIIESCASDIIDNQDDLLRYIGCILKRNYTDPEWIGNKCAEELYLPVWNEIQNCWKGPKGLSLLQESGEKTRALGVEFKTFPTVIINGSLNNQSQILNDLENYLREIANMNLVKEASKGRKIM